MRPDLYLRIVLLLVNPDIIVSSFSIIEFLSLDTEELVKNVGAQALGYGFGVLTDRPIEPIKFLLTLISDAPQAYDFLSQSQV